MTSATLVEGGSTFYSLREFHEGQESLALMSPPPSNHWTFAMSHGAAVLPGTYTQIRFERLVRTLADP